MKRDKIQKITYHVRSYSYQKKDRLAGLYLGVTIERKTIKIPLEIYFKEVLFDATKEQYKYDFKTIPFIRANGNTCTI
ncbi:hypothetical protein [Pedobacter cryophilus]|uniref:hypothetical protein n=1 Tax=Pedobacter cryophilus TaxID=2571271 RepID=UPI0010AD946E|nr:hypothetical protein [Pedobacter cryophilus]